MTKIHFTLDERVKTALDRLARDERTAGKYFSALTELKKHLAVLEEDLRAVRRNYSPKAIEQKGIEYVLFVVPSASYVIHSVYTFCLICRESDARVHAYAFSNCGSYDEYERTRVSMMLEVGRIIDLGSLLDS